MNYAAILSFAKYVPERIVSNDEMSHLIDTSDEWIRTRTGIKERHISLGENVSDMSVKVCEQLLSNSGVSPESIGMIIVSTACGDYLTPSSACIVQGKIGARNAFAFDINVGCTGFIYALSIAEKYIAARICEYAIVIGCEVLSKFTDWNDRSTCVLFGDGAGGVLIGRSHDNPGIIAENLHADGSRYSSLIGMPMPVTNAFIDDSPTWEKIGIKMDGREIFDFATKKVPESINDLLSKAGITFDDVKYIVPHQANYRIVEAVARKLKVEIDKFYINIDRYGNTSSATIPIALTEMSERGLIKFGNRDKVILTGFGSGLTWGSVLIEI